MPPLLLDITLVFALAVLAALAGHRLRLPLPAGLLLVGVLAGPDLLGLVRAPHEIEQLSEIGVVLLLFVIGLEISLADLAQLRRPFLVGGGLQFAGTTLVAALLLAGMGLPWNQGIYLGFTAALSSTAIVLRLLQERSELDSPHGRAALACLIFQDVAVVPVMLLAPLLAGATASSHSPGDLLLRTAAVGLFLLLAWRWGVPWLLGRITATRSREAFLLGVVALCLGIALLTHAAGLSLALGAFLAGLILAESDFSHQAASVVLPFRDIFLSLFFVSTGMLLDLDHLMAHPGQILLLTLAVLALKPVLAALSTLALGLPLRPAVQAGLALGQVGEFSLVAARVGVGAGLLAAGHFQAVLSITVLSMLATPLLVAAGPRLAQWLTAGPLGRRWDRPESANDERPRREGHVLIVGYGVTGRNLARTCRLSGVPYLVLDLNAATVREARAAGEPIEYGDATQEGILLHADAHRARAIVVVVNDPAGVRRIVELARRVAPSAYLLVRSRYLVEVEPLLVLGADDVIADELEMSVEVFSRVLARMLVPREEIKRLIDEVRGEWRRMARSLSREATSPPVHQVELPGYATRTLRLAPDSPLAGQSIAQSRLRQGHGITVLAVSREGTTTANPPGDFVLRAGDVLFVIGPLEMELDELSI